jgi:EAL domain-containing protein (putative c-di-GMP-specific phosphodiesterase class I)/DICT domain-containing protein
MDFGEIVNQQLVSSVYQSVIELASGRVVGYEALARGPEGGELERPDVLFTAARRAGLLPEVDRACRLAAVAGALDAGLNRSTMLFVNVEPDALATIASESEGELWQHAEQKLSLAVEFTGGSLRSLPAALTSAVRACRKLGWAIALDDVGADAGQLALMGLVAPDVIKLNLPLLRQRSALERAEILNAVWAQRERTGATIAAVGVEHERDLEDALALGATVGQGWHWGRPGALPRAGDEQSKAPAGGPSPFALREPSPSEPATSVSPYDTLVGARSATDGSAELLSAISRQLERHAAGLGGEAIVLGAFQHGRNFTAPARRRYRTLAEQGALVAAIGEQMGLRPTAGVRGADLADGDALREEWVVVVLAPHFAAALAGKPTAVAVKSEANDDDAPAEHPYSYVLTHDRDLVIAAARVLLDRLPPESSGGAREAGAALAA